MTTTTCEDSRRICLRGVQLREDQVRKTWVLLAPERFVQTEPDRVEILQLCDGSRSLAAIVAGLAAKDSAPTRAVSSATCARCSPRCSRNGVAYELENACSPRPTACSRN